MGQRIKEYIFLDESGKPEVYSRKGVNLVTKKLASKYLVIAAVRTRNQLSIQREVTDLQQNPAQLYAVVSGELLKRFLHTAKDMEVIFSRRDSSLKAKQNLQLIINSARSNYASAYKLDSGVNIVYHHNPHYSHGGLQIADYIAYAIFQVFENNTRQYYDIIKSRIGYIQDIFNKKSYSRSNPL